jgi:16S rRNA (guanine966-N2)-methyltransferase
MRIVGGRFRGRALAAPAGQGTRPTSDRARQAIFNILEHAPWAPALEGRRVIDLFAGSGALGFEALSRGASFCLFVETDEGARGAIRDTVEALGLFGATRVHRRDAATLGPRPGGMGGPFGLAFLDPPYGQGLAERALAELRHGGWLTEDAAVVVERGADEPAFAPVGFEVVDALP